MDLANYPMFPYMLRILPPVAVDNAADDVTKVIAKRVNDGSGMERRVLFSLRESRKVAALPPPSSGTSDLVFMKELAKRLFSGLQSNDDFIIQNFEAIFKEWVDVDHSFVAEDKQKFRIVDISVKEAEKVNILRAKGSACISSAHAVAI